MSREAMKLALEALEQWNTPLFKRGTVITALKQALEQPEPEPVAWTLLLVGEHTGIIGKAGETFESHPKYYKRVDVYTSPPKREWQGLTDDEMSEIYYHTDWAAVNGWEYERLIEAKLKEKNGI